jgi:hypothetical protein
VVANSAGAAPTVTSNPTSQTINSGQSVTFAAAASGSPAPGVQWQVSIDNGLTFTDVPGANSTELSLAATGLMNGDEFRAVFSNGLGRATTAISTLTVKNFAPIIITQPTSASVKAGTRVSFTVNEIADPAATIQWQRANKGSKKFTNIRGSMASTLRVSATVRSNGQKFRAVIKNQFGQVISSAVTLAVKKSKSKK